MNEFAVAVG